MSFSRSSKQNGLAGKLLPALTWTAGGAGVLSAQSGAGGALLVLVGLGLSLWAPAWSLVLLALSVPFEQPAAVGRFTVYTGEVLLAACVLGTAWAMIRHRAWQRALVSLLPWLGPFVLALLVSTGQAWQPATIKGALHWLEFIVALVLCVMVLRRGREAERVLTALVLAAVLSSCWGLYQVWAGNAGHPDLAVILVKQTEVTRAAAGYGANTLAMLLALVIPWVGVSACLHPKSGARLAARLALVVLLAGWWATFSITGWLALTMAGLVLLFNREVSWKWRLRLIFLALGFLACLLWLRPELARASLWQVKWFSWQDRLDYWALGGRLFLLSPIWGQGPGMYHWLAPLWGGGLNPVGVLMHPHSLYVTVLAELGIAGLVTLVWGGLRAMRFFQRCSKHWRPGYENWAGWSLLAGLAGFAAANFFEHGLIHDRGVHAALFLGAALVWARRPPRPVRQPRARFARVWSDSRSQPSAAAWQVSLREQRQGRAPLYALLEHALAGQGAAEILEMGCGPALDALNLANDPRYQVTGVDISAQALGLGRGAARALGKKLRLELADARRTPFADGRFDLVFSQGLFEHFPDPEPLWREMRRVLKPGGCAVVDVPQTWNPYTLAKFWHGLKNDWPWGWETQYTAPDLRRAGRRHGFRPLAARGYGYRRGPLDFTDLLRRWGQAFFPAGWAWLEKNTGAFWMMNVAVLFKKI